MIYINSKIINQINKDKANELEKANMMLQLAQKEQDIQEIKTENAFIMLEIANMKGV